MRRVRRGDEFASVAIATPALQNVVRRSWDLFQRGIQSALFVNYKWFTPLEALSPYTELGQSSTYRVSSVNIGEPSGNWMGMNQ